MTDYRGARGSNTGDDFHEVWATRQAIRLLNGEEDLKALTVEGVQELGGSVDTWDGVDCALYFGGPDAASANHVRLAQLKYSGASPEAPWTVARLTYAKAGSGKAKDGSVIARLTKAWKAMRKLRPGAPPPSVALVTNQPVSPELLEAVKRASTATLTANEAYPFTWGAPFQIQVFCAHRAERESPLRTLPSRAPACSLSSPRSRRTNGGLGDWQGVDCRCHRPGASHPLPSAHEGSVEPMSC